MYDPRRDHAMLRRKSTRELVAQFEQATAARNSPKKDHSPLRNSFQNLLSVFKKGKSPNREAGRQREEPYRPPQGFGDQRPTSRSPQGRDYRQSSSSPLGRDPRQSASPKGREPHQGVSPQQRRPPPDPGRPQGRVLSYAEPTQRQSRPPSIALQSGQLFYLSHDRQWKRRHVSLEPPVLYMADPVLATPSLAMRLETLTSVHSLPRSSALTLPAIPTRDSDDAYVFELEFEGGNRVELFAVESVSTRASWVSALWDAVLSMQPGPSLPPASQLQGDPFLAHAGSPGQSRQLRVTNGSVPNSPSSDVLTSPMLPGDADNSQGSGSGGKSKLAHSITRQVLGMETSASNPADSGRPRPLPVLPNPSSHRKKPSTVDEETEEETDDEGADIIRFPSAFSDRHTGQLAADEPPPVPPKPISDSPAIPPSPASIQAPTPVIDRKLTHDTIRLSGMRSPSPSISRNSSYADSSALGRSPRSPSIQTLSQLSVVKMRLAKLEPGEARVIPSASPREVQKADALAGTTPARIDLNTPPLTIRKRPDPLHSPPLPPPPNGDGSVGDSTAYESASGGDGLTDSSSTETTTSASISTPPQQHADMDLQPLLSMLKPIPPQYAMITSTMEGVKDSLEHVRTGVHRVLHDVGDLRENISAMNAKDTKPSGEGHGQGLTSDEAFDHIRRQLSELIMLVADGFSRSGPHLDDGSLDTDIGRTMRNVGKETTPGESRADEAETRPEGVDSSASLKEVTARFEELTAFLTPLFDQHKHMQSQQLDTIRYLNELNPWLQRLATTAEKTEDVPQDVQRIARALGVEKPKDEADVSAKGGKTLVEELMAKLDDVRTSIERSREERSMPAMDAVLESLSQQRLEQEKLLRSVAADLSNDIRGERLRFVDAMKEATTVNVQTHLEEFKKQLNQEVMRMTQEVGHLRDEKTKLEQAIAELFALKAKHGEHQVHQVEQQVQQHARRASQAPNPVPNQYGAQRPHPVPPGSYVQQPQQPHSQDGFYQGNVPRGQLQMPHPLAGQSPHSARQHTQGRPLPVAGLRSNPSSAPRPGRQ